MKTYIAALSIAALSLAVQAEPIFVPNASFELPQTGFVATNMVSWAVFPTQDFGEIGVFFNNPSNGPGFFIGNCDGSQAAYIFNDTGLALYQDFASQDSTGATSTNFTATFEVGKSYELQAGLIGGDQGGAPGVILQMSLYYRDSSNNVVTVAATNVVNDPSVFTSITNLVDYALVTPPVQPTDPWAGRHIGIQFLSIVPANISPGGDWDLDNVRLSGALAPALLNPAWSNGQFSVALKSDPGLVFQILTTTNLTIPTAGWTDVGTFTNVSGMDTFTDSSATSSARFYQAKQLQP